MVTALWSVQIGRCALCGEGEGELFVLNAIQDSQMMQRNG